VNGKSGPTPSQEERNLLARARAGDAGAFDALAERYGEGLLRVAYALVGERAGAEDVVQETLMAAFSGLPGFRGESSVRTWLVSILTRQAARYNRREARRRHKPIADAEGLRDAAAGNRQDVRIDLAAALRGLEETYRQVIVLREIEGLSYDEIARVLGVPRGTVESRLYRAREALRERLGGYYD